MALSASAFAKNAVSDWQAVKQDIPSGWQIIVVTSLTFPCVFQSASDEELICEPLQRDYSRPNLQAIHVRRDRIHEIRAEKRNGTNALALGAIGGLAGGGFGAVGGRVTSAYLFGILGSAMGAHRGSRVHILRGKVIYRRP